MVGRCRRYPAQQALLIVEYEVNGNALLGQALQRHVRHAQAVDTGAGRYPVTVRLSQVRVRVPVSAERPEHADCGRWESLPLGLAVDSIRPGAATRQAEKIHRCVARMRLRGD